MENENTMTPEEGTGSEPVNQNTPEDTGLPEKTDDGGAVPPEDEPKVSEAEKRIKRLVAQRKQTEALAAKAQEEAAYWRGVAEAKKAPEPSNTAPVKPDMNDFESIDEYEAARDKYYEDRLEWKFAQERAKVAKEAEAQVTQQESKAINANFDKVMASAIEADPEIEEMRDTVGVLINQNMAGIIKQSNAAPDLIRYLHDNPDEITRIKSLNTVAQTRELLKIEVRLTTPATPEKKVTQAPKPITTLNTNKGGIVTVSEDDMPIDEWMARERKKRLERMGR